MPTKKPLLALPLIAAGALLAAGCGESSSKAADATTAAAPTPAASAAPAAASGPATAATITLGQGSESAVSASTTSLAAGSVTLTLTNAGAAAHEVLVVPARNGRPAPANALLAPSTAGPSADVLPGATTTLTLKASAGQYAVLVGKPGRFANAQTTILTVS